MDVKKCSNTNELVVCNARNDGDENEKNPCKVPVFMDCGIGNCATEYMSARNIEHPVVIPRDVSFAPDSREFYTQGYQCILAIAPNPAKIRRAAYLAQNLDAGLYVAS